MNNEGNSNGDGSGRSESAISLLSSHLIKMSFHERESINEEIHGINIDRKYIEESGSVEETPGILFKSLRELQNRLDVLRSTDSGVGGIACAFNRSQELFGSTPEKGTYFNTNDLRLMFLRCERFDCLKAAKRLCSYANLLYEFYGDFALQRAPLFSDLDDDEATFIRNGFSHIYPSRDRAGRRIYAHFLDTDLRFSEKTRYRIPIYLLHSLLSTDVVTQRRGAVYIFWMHNVKQWNINDFMRRGYAQNRIGSSLPVRVGAVHYCFPSMQSARTEAFANYFTSAAIVCGQTLAKMRIHTGSTIECTYALESFGISSKSSPLNIITGGLNLTNHIQWLKFRLAMERNPSLLKSIIECPNHSDILFGRGQIVMNHPGNTMFRNFIQSNLEMYSNIRTKKESTQWTWGVVRKLKAEYAARFLKEERIDTDVTAWVEVTNEIARSKVRIAFRDAITRLAKSTEKDSNVNNNIKSRGKFGTTMANKRSGGISKASPTRVPSLLLSNRKNGKITASHVSPPLSPLLQQEQEPEEQYDMHAVTLAQMNNHFSDLNANLSQLNNNLSAVVNNQQVADSSTYTFMGMNSSDSKRQFMDSKHCFCLM